MSVARLLVLGIVRMHGRAHGYMVKHEWHSWSVEKWTSVKAGSIYHALKQLTKQQMLRVVRVEDSKEGPERTIYELTKKGEIEFRKLLDEALTSTDLEFMGAGIALMQTLPRSHVIDLLRKREHQLQEIRDYLYSLRKSYPNPGDPEQLQELLGLLGTHFGSDAKWTAGLIKRLETGKYTMADDDSDQSDTAN